MLESLVNKVKGLQICNFINKTLQHRCFPVKIAKFFKNTYFETHLQTAASGLLPMKVYFIVQKHRNKMGLAPKKNNN